MSFQFTFMCGLLTQRPHDAMSRRVALLKTRRPARDIQVGSVSVVGCPIHAVPGTAAGCHSDSAVVDPRVRVPEMPLGCGGADRIAAVRRRAGVYSRSQS